MLGQIVIALKPILVGVKQREALICKHFWFIELKMRRTELFSIDSVGISNHNYAYYDLIKRTNKVQSAANTVAHFTCVFKF